MAEIRFPCSGCGVTLRVGSTVLAGKKLKCPKCAAISVIPVPADEASPAVRTTAPKASQPKPSPNPASAPAKPQPRTTATPSSEAVWKEAEPAPLSPPKKKTASAPAAISEPRAPAHGKSRPADTDDDGEERALPTVKKEKRPRRGPGVIVIGVAVLALVLLSYAGAAFFGLFNDPLGLIPNPNPKGNNQPIIAGQQPQPKPNPQPRQDAVSQNTNLPKRDNAVEAAQSAEREKRRQAVATTERQISATLHQPNLRTERRRNITLPLVHPGVTQLAFSPDGQFLASTGANRAVKIWDLRTGACKHDLPGNGMEGGQLAFSPDGRALASTSENKKIQLWDVQTGQLKRELVPQTNSALQGVAFSDDGKWVFAGGAAIERWDLNTGQTQPLSLGGLLDAQHFAVRPDGKVLATKDLKQEIGLWALPAGTRYPKSFPAPSVEQLTFSPDGWILAFLEKATEGQTVKLCNVETGTVSEPKLSAGAISCLGFSPDGKWLAVGGTGSDYHGSLQLWDLATNKEVGRSDGRNLGAVTFLAFSPGGTLLATYDGREAIRIWEVADFLNDGPPVLVPEELKKLVGVDLLGKTLSLEIRSKGTDAVLAQAAKLKGLTELSLFDCKNVTENGFASLKDMKELRWFHNNSLLSPTHFNDACLAFLQNASSLEELDLSGTATITDAGLAHLVGLKNLKKLVLSRTPITDAGLAHLAKLTSLESLDLSLTGVTGAGLVHLKNLTKLRSLSLVERPLTDESLANLAGLTQLTDLQIGGTGISNAGLVHLKGLTALLSLNLSGNEAVDGTGLGNLKDMTKLQALYLYGVGVKDAELSFLSGFPMLTQLDLGGTKITDAGLAHIAGLTQLTQLNLNTLKDLKGPGLKHLKNLTRLTNLMLIDTPITDGELAALQPLTRLETLYLVRSQVTDAGLVHLYGLKKLKSVSLDETKVTEQGKEGLRKALPRIQLF